MHPNLRQSAPCATRRLIAYLMTDESPSIDKLLKNLDHGMLADRHRLRRQLLELRKKPDEAKLAQWVTRMQASCYQVLARRASLPVIRYDDSLPIAAKRDGIKAALLKHQVLIIAGETGSGKTTQLPKICLEIGRGQHGLIGHTQPRRIAARSVASRVAEELATPLGALVGYQVRFEDQSDSNTLIKLMTDGILLAETQNDRYLERYDTIIVDEAHERSLNIDFLLGYLKTLLPRRPDLKVIITSATIDLERFSKHFDDAPIVEVSGRTFPVDTWYRPLTLEQDEEGNRVEDDLTVDQAILATLDEIAAYERSERRSPGDVLVYLPGEREIRGAAEMLRKAQLKHTEILPLYARLSPAEQQRQNFGVLELGLAQHLGGVTNLALARQEHQHIARAAPLAAFIGSDFIQGSEDRLVDGQVVLDAVALLVLLQGQRAIPGVHREGTARDLDNRCIVEVLGKTLQVDGRRGDDDFQVGATRQQGFQVAKQEVDVQAAFVGFVDDDRVVAFQVAVVLSFRQQDAVGHQLDQGVGVTLVFETHLIADQRAQRRGQFFGDAAGDAARGDSARLGVADQAVLATADFQADFRQLGGFTRAGFTGDDKHLMLLQRLFDLVALGGNRQAGAPRRDLCAGRLHARDPLRQLVLVGLLAQLEQLAPQAVAVGEHGVIEVFQQLVDSGRLVSHQVL